MPERAFPRGSSGMKKILLALIGILAITSLASGGMLARWVDSDSHAASFEAASIDLKVAGESAPFEDDPLGPYFEIDCGGLPSFRVLELWNTGEEGGDAYLHIQNVSGDLSDALLMNVQYYDQSNVWVTLTGWAVIGDLECVPIGLFYLNPDDTGKVMILIDLPPGSQGSRVEWDIEFGIHGSWVDTETSEGNYFECQLECGTAWAHGGDYATCFLSLDLPDLTSEKWGWTNGQLSEGDYVFDIYFGAGQCDFSKGTLVGTLTVEYHEGTAEVTYEAMAGFWMDKTHLYVGSEILPTDGQGEFTVAPGQFPSQHDLLDATEDTYDVTGLSGDIYVAAHAHGCRLVTD